MDAIEQMVYFVEKKEKSLLLVSILQKSEDQSVLVFSRTKHNADKIVKILGKAGIGSQAIHGNKSQAARQLALGNFKSGKTRVMVATDIAARGIDINELPLVINYDLPASRMSVLSLYSRLFRYVRYDAHTFPAHQEDHS